MMKLKPSFVSKLNPDGHSPIHLALINGRTRVIKIKIDVKNLVISSVAVSRT